MTVKPDGEICSWVAVCVGWVHNNTVFLWPDASAASGERATISEFGMSWYIAYAFDEYFFFVFFLPFSRDDADADLGRFFRAGAPLRSSASSRSLAVCAAAADIVAEADAKAVAEAEADGDADFDGVISSPGTPVSGGSTSIMSIW